MNQPNTGKFFKIICKKKYIYVFWAYNNYNIMQILKIQISKKKKPQRKTDLKI